MYEVRVTLDVSARFEDALLRLGEALAGIRNGAPAAPQVEMTKPITAPDTAVSASLLHQLPTAGECAPVAPAPAQTAVQTPAAQPTPVISTPAPVVTAAPSYTLEQINKAGADLLTARPDIMPQLQALNQQFGVRYAGQLKPEQFGAFATALRGLGANI
jgi:hypothetical protein